MLSPRRFLPSLSLLAAFEATARLGSVTAAARELNLTQSAVSRQIAALEAQLEVELFHRERQTVRLTAGGEAYAREVREALKIISSASLSLRANPHGGTLKLAILPTFGTRWLAPRLPDFLRNNSGIQVNLITRIGVFDFRSEGLDAAIHFGRPGWPGAESALLRPEVVIPACAPELKAQYGFAEPADLRQAPLLHLTSRPDAWENWLEAHSAPSDHVHGMLFDQFATLAQVARSGLGVALLPQFLAEEEFASGSLVPALEAPLSTGEAYHLVWPAERSNHPPLKAFRDWLLKETATYR
ncbi:LysR family transcriptional regulator [Asticcacaulis excentricus]|uniref:Transcriptional regulator, LysR family n=1 Tax=Asticcacaulis excentricus (strain ATCC 15261 / DSM 4724 / KCTC 12464 / NCIMB 9791 / VKM B-1370 / CB 48) TaxID=573065 RepID=E8RLG9_ASTEC|nr:LysR family transcriptional regulator [Asticcacaulis excentricus]ADU13713.1 transcriptional regulator, LysR family [Asticcacaulis excentricus CB 48]